MKSLLFDTNCCSWNTSNSNFIDHIQGNRIVIVMEDTKGKRIGAYFKRIESTISTQKSVTSKTIQIRDSTSYLFETPRRYSFVLSLSKI